MPPAFALLFCALTQPLPDPPAPFPPPDGIVQGESGPALSGGLLLVWVPPVVHWLGDAALTGRFAAPPRRHRPAAGFFIAAVPIGPMTFAEAGAELAQMAQRTGLAIGLPDPDAWEMAARGPDARRFAWGCSAAKDARIDLSPWGMAGACTGPGEWPGASSPGDRPSMAGGEALPIRAVRARCDPKESLLIRPFIGSR